PGPQPWRPAPNPPPPESLPPCGGRRSGHRPEGGRVKRSEASSRLGAAFVFQRPPAGRWGGHLPREGGGTTGPPFQSAGVAAGRRSPRRSRSGMNDRTGGTRSKLYGGGGELVAHSRVLPSHGSSPATSPLRQLTTRLIRKISTDSATRNDATVMNAFVAP